MLGQGWGDPTQGKARMSSGASRWLFSRSKVVVTPSLPSSDLLQAGYRIAEYENLPLHAQAICKNLEVLNKNAGDTFHVPAPEILDFRQLSRWK